MTRLEHLLVITVALSLWKHALWKHCYIFSLMDQMIRAYGFRSFCPSENLVNKFLSVEDCKLHCSYSLYICLDSSTFSCHQHCIKIYPHVTLDDSASPAIGKKLSTLGFQVLSVFIVVAITFWIFAHIKIKMRTPAWVAPRPGYVSSKERQGDKNFLTEFWISRYSYMIDNIILLITGTLRQRPINELIPKCHPLGSFEQMEAIHIASTPAELYNAVLVDTPLGKLSLIKTKRTWLKYTSFC